MAKYCPPFCAGTSKKCMQFPQIKNIDNPALAFRSKGFATVQQLRSYNNACQIIDREVAAGRDPTTALKAAGKMGILRKFRYLPSHGTCVQPGCHVYNNPNCPNYKPGGNGAGGNGAGGNEIVYEEIPEDFEEESGGSWFSEEIFPGLKGGHLLALGGGGLVWVYVLMSR